MKQRVFRPEEKAEMLSTYDRLPETGERGRYLKENRLSWRLFSHWRADPAVKALLGAQPEPSAPALGFTMPKVVKGAKRQFTLRQKAAILAAYDALPAGTKARTEFLIKYRLHWNMLNRWRGDCKREGIPIPNLKLKAKTDLAATGRIINGHADMLGRPARRPGPGRPPKKKAGGGGGFETVEDAIAWLDIRIEESTKIREELKAHVGKTRNE